MCIQLTESGVSFTFNVIMTNYTTLIVSAYIKNEYLISCIIRIGIVFAYIKNENLIPCIIRIGKAISTKIPDGKVCKSDMMDVESLRFDITSQYKYEDGK